MSSIREILSKKQFEEPPEIQRIKDFVEEKFHARVSVAVQPNQIVITAVNAALAATLRLHLLHLQEAAKTSKRFVFRIGKS